MRGKGPALRLGVVEAGALFAATERSQQRPKAGKDVGIRMLQVDAQVRL